MESFVDGDKPHLLRSPLELEQVVHRQSLSAQLKEQTHDAHRALEKTPGMGDLMSPGLTLAHYVHLLEKWWCCWVPLEIALNQCITNPLNAGLLPARRSHRLRNDLHSLGASHALTVSQHTLPNMQKSGWLGAAYVMQGAQMGSAVISAHLSKTLKLSDSGATFFRPVTPIPVAAIWRDWCEQLNAIEFSETDAHAVVQTAKQTFAYMEAHFA